MDSPNTLGRRNFLAGAAVTGAAAVGASLAALGVGPREAMAQILDTGIDPKSVLAKIKKGETLNVGFSQTPAWFYKDPKSGELQGIYKDLVDLLAKDLEMKVNFVEVTFANSTVGLRKGDYDLFGSSLVYTVPRGLVCNYIGPIWSKGSLGIVHKDDAKRFTSFADLNRPDVTFSVNAGASEEQRIPLLFPKAKMIAVAGQQAMAAEPVRTRRATVYVTGDLDAIAFAKRNASWAQIVDEKHPFDKRPNTWAIRHGDEPWKNFLDMWSTYVIVNGLVQALYDEYLAKLA